MTFHGYKNVFCSPNTDKFTRIYSFAFLHGGPSNSLYMYIYIYFLHYVRLLLFDMLTIHHITGYAYEFFPLGNSLQYFSFSVPKTVDECWRVKCGPAKT